MENNSTLSGRCVLFSTITSLLIFIVAHAHTTSLQLQFANSIAVSGTSEQNSATSKLSNFIPGMDAFVKIDDSENAKLVKIDDS